ncbi:MAG: CPBP family intramembrane metalloprotease [Alphaproteobacteria bacterium]|nr:CPBP family intramembrane metalloprotease [Alphaproteobacteria bacterium]
MSGVDEKLNFDLRMAASLRAMGPLGATVAFLIVASVLLAPPIAAVFVFIWIWLSRTPFSEIGLARPGSWLGVLVLGVAAGVGAKLLMKAVVMPYFGAPPTNAMLAPLEGDMQAALIASAEMIVLAGFAEEVVFRGFLFNRLQTAFGTGWFARGLMILGVALFFGGLHYFGQGYFGALNATIMGFLFCVIYFLNKQRLWFLIVMHAAFDVCAVWLTALGIEEQVARSVFG